MGVRRWWSGLVAAALALVAFAPRAVAVEPVLDPGFDGRLLELVTLQGLAQGDGDNVALEELAAETESSVAARLVMGQLHELRAAVGVVPPLSVLKEPSTPRNEPFLTDQFDFGWRMGNAAGSASSWVRVRGSVPLPSSVNLSYFWSPRRAGTSICPPLPDAGSAPEDWWVIVSFAPQGSSYTGQRCGLATATYSPSYEFGRRLEDQLAQRGAPSLGPVADGSAAVDAPGTLHYDDVNNCVAPQLLGPPVNVGCDLRYVTKRQLLRRLVWSNTVPWTTQVADQSTNASGPTLTSAQVLATARQRLGEPDFVELRGWLNAVFSPPAYVALGDSYSSGLGAGAYDPNSRYKDRPLVPPFGPEPGPWGNCWHSANAYPQLLADPVFTGGQISPFGLRHVACQAATTDVLDDAVVDDRGLTDDVAQLEYLTDETQLVTVTIGGNDLRFGPILTDCIKDFW